ncbi:chemotaxis-specific protein-glutamate methyltransferase CheB [Paenibacillus sp. G2S3]|uniref:chemotaxis-specific protein-glutamate methyltransferase CheB n=1 Tax=Paenibacillus sp. G2S3 TaxID=3047872 RepID=UPI0024C0EE4D|nr:chemotaxis-specific protein-glutamate methyltransferase CheB [Paenibacillus sp. G2S3]WHY17935.1 chemotaxis-specific protein-glutamate methyltransferase CheB [Paenibacillus sp. G2S3]
MQKLKVLVVATSVMMRKQISNLIVEDSIIEVIGAARNASEAVSMVQELRPDVVTIDIEVPELNSLVAISSIMSLRPTPILILSSETKDGISATITGLQNGAVDFIPKPTQCYGTDLSQIKDELIFKIKQAAQIPLRTLILNNITVSKVIAGQQAEDNFKIGYLEKLDQIVAIGCGVGGPKALEIAISSLPADFPYPLLIVQHMPSKYTKALAERLNRFSSVRVVEAKDDQLVLGGTAYIAPGNCHMTVVQQGHECRIKLHRKAPVNGYRPSIDVLFDSISGLKSMKQHLILMTGIGNDGARGMLSAKQAGAQSTLVESQETSIVNEMPEAAVELGCVDYEVPSFLLASKIMEVTGLLDEQI